MFNAGILASRIFKPVGEIILVAGTSWVCPPGVTSACAVLVGKGGDGRTPPSWGNNVGGGGGALVYKNGIVLVPGQSYAYSITASGTTIFGMTAGAGTDGFGEGQSGTASGGIGYTAGSPTARFNGSSGRSGGYGGSAATYTADGSTSLTQGIGLLGPSIAGDYGRGGSNVQETAARTGGPGAIRIIWGDGRSFPNNALPK